MKKIFLVFMVLATSACVDGISDDYPAPAYATPVYATPMYPVQYENTAMSQAVVVNNNTNVVNVVPMPMPTVEPVRRPGDRPVVHNPSVDRRPAKPEFKKVEPKKPEPKKQFDAAPKSFDHRPAPSAPVAPIAPKPQPQINMPTFDPEPQITMPAPENNQNIRGNNANWGKGQDNNSKNQGQGQIRN